MIFLIKCYAEYKWISASFLEVLIYVSVLLTKLQKTYSMFSYDFFLLTSPFIKEFLQNRASDSTLAFYKCISLVSLQALLYIFVI